MLSLHFCPCVSLTLFGKERTRSMGKARRTKFVQLFRFHKLGISRDASNNSSDGRSYSRVVPGEGGVENSCSFSERRIQEELPRWI